MYGSRLLKRPSKKTAVHNKPLTQRATLSKVVLIAAGMVFMLLVESLFWPGRGLVWRSRPMGAKGSSSFSPTTNNHPWGQLEYVPIALDRPEEYFTNDFTHSPKNVWVFRNHTEQQLLALFGSLDLTSGARAWLTDRKHWQPSADSIRMAPPPETVLSLNEETRRQLYQLLGRIPENYPQFTPFRFRANGFDDWFADCGLSEEKVKLVRRLTYPQEGALCFADAAAFAQVSTAEETKCLLKSLWRVSTFVIKVRIGPQTDVPALLQYWGTANAARAYKPLIESMARVPESATINVSYFLPPFARLRLYTYPNPRDPNVGREDCFWSSMNFFNHTPDNGFFNPDYTRKVLAADYARVRDDSRLFGDLLLLLGKDQEALHMCVYIADGVVFTKNGANTQQPWVFMKFSEMLNMYEREKPFEVVPYRRTTPPPLGLAVELSSTANAL